MVYPVVGPNDLSHGRFNGFTPWQGQNVCSMVRRPTTGPVDLPRSGLPHDGVNMSTPWRGQQVYPMTGPNDLPAEGPKCLPHGGAKRDIHPTVVSTGLAAVEPSDLAQSWLSSPAPTRPGATGGTSSCQSCTPRAEDMAQSHVIKLYSSTSPQGPAAGPCPPRGACPGARTGRLRGPSSGRRRRRCCRACPAAIGAGDGLGLGAQFLLIVSWIHRVYLQRLT